MFTKLSGHSNNSVTFKSKMINLPDAVVNFSELKLVLSVKITFQFKALLKTANIIQTDLTSSDSSGTLLL